MASNKISILAAGLENKGKTTIYTYVLNTNLYSSIATKYEEMKNEGKVKGYFKNINLKNYIECVAAEMIEKLKTEEIKIERSLNTTFIKYIKKEMDLK